MSPAIMQPILRKTMGSHIAQLNKNINKKFRKLIMISMLRICMQNADGIPFSNYIAIVENKQ